MATEVGGKTCAADEHRDGEDRWRLQDGRVVHLASWDLSAGTFPEVLLVVRACEWKGLGNRCRFRLILFEAIIR